MIEGHRYQASIRAALAIVAMLDVHPGSGRALLVGKIAFKILEEIYAAEESEPAPGIAWVPSRN